MAIQKSTIDLLNIQGTSAQLANVKTLLTATQKAIFTNTDTKRMYLCENGKDPMMLGADVQNVTYADGVLTITPVDGSPVSITLTIDDELSGLETKITNAYTSAIASAQEETLKTVGNTYINKNKITDNTSDDSTLVLSAKGGKTIIEYANTKVSSVTGNLVTNSGTDSTHPKVDFFAHYDSVNNKIWFYKGTAQLSNPTTSNTICSIDTSDFIYKGMIDDVRFDPDTKGLTIDFNTASGKADITIDMTSLVDTYGVVANGGLFLNDNEFGVNAGNGLTVNSQGELQLEVTGAGLSLDSNGLALDSAWLNRNFIATIAGDGVQLKGAVSILGAVVTKLNELTGTIDVHPKWYTIVD